MSVPKTATPQGSPPAPVPRPPGPGHPLLRAAAETVMVFGLLCWIYVAAVAAFRPDSLNASIASVLPLRRDTSSVLCFTASAFAAFLLHARTGRFWARRPGRRGTAEAALRVLIGYCLLAWAYLCVNNLTHPSTTGLHLTHFAAHPAEGTTADICFAAAAVALFLLRAGGGRNADV